MSLQIAFQECHVIISVKVASEIQVWDKSNDGSVKPYRLHMGVFFIPKTLVQLLTSKMIKTRTSDLVNLKPDLALKFKF